MKAAVSAGGVIVEDGKILLVKLTHVVGYTFPKGHIKTGESEENAAIREVREETGYQEIRIIKKLGVVTRPAVERDDTRVMKDIHLFLMKIEGRKMGVSEEKVEWRTVDEAMNLLFPEEAEFLRLNLTEINKG